MFTYRFLIDWEQYYYDAKNIIELKKIVKEKLWVTNIIVTQRIKNYFIPN